MPLSDLTGFSPQQTAALRGIARLRAAGYTDAQIYAMDTARVQAYGSDNAAPPNPVMQLTNMTAADRATVAQNKADLAQKMYDAAIARVQNPYNVVAADAADAPYHLGDPLMTKYMQNTAAVPGDQEMNFWSQWLRDYMSNPNADPTQLAQGRMAGLDPATVDRINQAYNTDPAAAQDFFSSPPGTALGGRRTLHAPVTAFDITGRPVYTAAENGPEDVGRDGAALRFFPRHGISQSLAPGETGEIANTTAQNVVRRAGIGTAAPASPPLGMATTSASPMTSATAPQMSMIDIARSIRGTGGPFGGHNMLDFARLARAGMPADQMGKVAGIGPVTPNAAPAPSTPPLGTGTTGTARGGRRPLPTIGLPATDNIPPSPVTKQQAANPMFDQDAGYILDPSMGFPIPGYAGGGFYGFDTPQQAMDFANATRGASAQQQGALSDMARSQALGSINPGTNLASVEPVVGDTRYSASQGVTAGQAENMWANKQGGSYGTPGQPGYVAPGYIGSQQYNQDMVAGHAPRTNSWWGPDGKIHYASYDDPNNQPPPGGFGNSGVPGPTTGGGTASGSQPAPGLGQSSTTGASGTQPPAGGGTSQYNQSQQTAAKQIGSVLAGNTMIPPDVVSDLNAGNIPGLARISPSVWQHMKANNPAIAQQLVSLWRSTGQVAGTTDAEAMANVDASYGAALPTQPVSRYMIGDTSSF